MAVISSKAWLVNFTFSKFRTLVGLYMRPHLINQIITRMAMELVGSSIELQNTSDITILKQATKAFVNSSNRRASPDGRPTVENEVFLYWLFTNIATWL
jgi:hypothetical protein